MYRVHVYIQDVIYIRYIADSIGISRFHRSMYRIHACVQHVNDVQDVNNTMYHARYLLGTRLLVVGE